ncbi:MAG: glycine--tRNA ligase subunit alpha, partial [Pseudomonadota bacterium]
TGDKALTYGQVDFEAEKQFSKFNLEVADTEILFRHFVDAENQCKALIDEDLPMPAYEYCIKASHIFNLLCARGVVSVTERASYIARVRNLAKISCEKWMEMERETSK